MSELSGGNQFYHVAAIKRKEKIIIPKGNDKILNNDLVYFTTTPDHIEEIRILSGKEYTKIKYVMIMVVSRIAIRTADYAPDYMDIKIIEPDPD